MKKFKNFAKENYHIFLLLLMFCSALIIVSRTKFWDDDYRYYRVAICDWKEIFQFLKWHLQKYNGRTFVHFLVIMSLKNKVTVNIWRVSSAIVMCLINIIIAKITSNNKQEFKINSAVGVLVTMGTIPFFYKLSAYWQTGWFNYILPIFLILIVMLLCKKKQNSFWLFPLCLLCGATTEQGGLITVGLFVLLIIDYAINNKKLNSRYLICLILSCVGFATVVLSPGTYTRVGDQGKIGIKQMLINLVTILRKRWIDNICLFVMIIAINFFIVYWMVKFKNKNRFTAKVNLPLGISVSVLTVLSFCLKGFLGICVLLHKQIAFPKALNYFFFAVWIVYAFLFIFSFFYSALLIYIYRKENMPIIAVILGFGSQLMLIISEASMYRTCTPAFFLFFIYITYSAKCFVTEYKDSDKKIVKKYLKPEPILVTLCILACLCQIIVGLQALSSDIDHVSQEDFPLVPMNSEQMEKYTDFLEYKRKEVFSSHYWLENFDITDFTWLYNK
ncbi:MAG: hypothetical protein KBT46_00815 [Ruminococcus sp.]|nr:hypothetical protein [Candidatus Copronaster equi]